ncbi:coniferyl-alcohol dehydrogenase [Sphingomonas sp. GB1N7]|uniref:coniferyl-alcohol dehydrogenase n=1 Tax=Parasphingomonas caseinilytica TaxID=3096158 RepID=UPI002FCC7B24
MNLRGKRLIVTGVASGIGRATAALLRQSGATVIGLDRNDAADAVDEFHRIDLIDRASIRAAIDTLDGRYDGLCNIAGVPPTAPAATVLDVNFFATRELTEGLLNRLAPGASIVTVASLAGFGWRDHVDVVHEGLSLRDPASIAGWLASHGIEGAPSYFLSKELVIAWTVAIAGEIAARGLRINTVSPGPVDTPILGDFIETMGARAEEDLRVLRAGRPDEIVGMIAFLCSDHARWCNGANYPVDGGAEANIFRGAFAIQPN